MDGWNIAGSACFSILMLGAAFCAWGCAFYFPRLVDRLERDLQTAAEENQTLTEKLEMLREMNAMLQATSQVAIRSQCGIKESP